MLNLYETNLAGVRKEFESLGLAVNSEDAKRIEKFNDDLSRLSQRFTAVGRNLLIDATPTALKALQGAEIILEATGLVERRLTAREQAAKAAGRSEAGTDRAFIEQNALRPFIGILGNLLGGNRGDIVDNSGEVLGRSFLFNSRRDLQNNASNAAIQARQLRALEKANEQRAKRARQRPVQLAPAGA